MTSREEAWARLRGLTPARIGLGRAGDGLPTTALLDFELAHARARDAVSAEIDTVGLQRELSRRLSGLPSVVVRSRIDNREQYLQRPDLGGLLHPDDVSKLSAGSYDVVFLIADGLSAKAVHAHAIETLAETVRGLPTLKLAPVVIATHARVALGDPVGAALGAHFCVTLIGERPGLSSPDSLGAYLTFGPHPGRNNAERNCVSNIRSEGLPPAAAGPRIAALCLESLRLKLSGVAVSVNSDALPAASRPELE